jgi:hypothetical protein
MWSRLLQRSVTGLLRVGSVCALVGLAVMCASLIWPRALLVIFAMSVGHVIGFGAFACYLLAVLVDTRRQRVGESTSTPTPAPPRAKDESAR